MLAAIRPKQQEPRLATGVVPPSGFVKKIRYVPRPRLTHSLAFNCRVLSTTQESRKSTTSA
ncbi:MAG: hypothetical protein QOI32_469 [Thermoleophilaceae bacterium]|nr:hypothetical protein [Thermoleophilaceae bacterium]